MHLALNRRHFGSVPVEKLLPMVGSPSHARPQRLPDVVVDAEVSPDTMTFVESSDAEPVKLELPGHRRTRSLAGGVPMCKSKLKRNHKITINK